MLTVLPAPPATPPPAPLLRNRMMPAPAGAGGAFLSFCRGRRSGSARGDELERLERPVVCLKLVPLNQDSTLPILESWAQGSCSPESPGPQLRSILAVLQRNEVKYYSGLSTCPLEQTVPLLLPTALGLSQVLHR